MSSRILTMGTAVWLLTTVSAGLTLPVLSTYDLAGEVPDADTDRLLTWLLPVSAAVVLPALVVAARLAWGHAHGIIADADTGVADGRRRSVTTPSPAGGWWRWVAAGVGGAGVVLLLRSVVDSRVAAGEALEMGVLLMLVQACLGLLVVLLGLFVGLPLSMVALTVQRRRSLGAGGASGVLALALAVGLIPVVGVAIQAAFGAVQSGGTPRGRAVARIVDVIFLAPASPAVLTARVLTLLLLVVTVYGVWQLRPARAHRHPE